MRAIITTLATELPFLGGAATGALTLGGEGSRVTGAGAGGGGGGGATAAAGGGSGASAAAVVGAIMGAGKEGNVTSFPVGATGDPQVGQNVALLAAGVRHLVQKR